MDEPSAARHGTKAMLKWPVTESECSLPAGAGAVLSYSEHVASLLHASMQCVKTHTAWKWLHYSTSTAVHSNMTHFRPTTTALWQLGACSLLLTVNSSSQNNAFNFVLRNKSLRFDSIYLSIYLSKKSRLGRRKCRDTTRAPNNVN